MEDRFIVEIPRFITEVKVSNARRAKHYYEGDEKKEKGMPQYLKDRIASGDLIFKKRKKNDTVGLLYDPLEGEFVIKNAGVAGQPRYVQIAGNEIMRAHEQIVNKMVNAIKDCFRPYLANLPKPLPTPIIISSEVLTPPRTCDWDIDNLWFYNKCFQDLLQDEGHLPAPKNDTIRAITGSGGILFTPVADENQRLWRFTIQRDLRSITYEHTMFKEGYIVPTRIATMGPNTHIGPYWNNILLSDSKEGNPGSVLIAGAAENQNPRQIHVIAYTGKKAVVSNAATKAMGKVYSLAVQMNACVLIEKSLYDRYFDYINTMLSSRAISVFIYENWNTLSSSS